MTSKYYSIYYVNNKDKNLKLVNSYEYFDNLEKAINAMLRYIENYKIPKYSKKFYTPINMDCDYNIRIYNVEVWKCLNNYNFKIEPISQAFPLVPKPSKELDKYIELCDLENMTVAKLCLEIYGENITMEKIKEMRKIKLDNLVNIINKKISESKYNKINIDMTGIFYKDNDKYIIYSTNNILSDLYKYYTNIGYIVKYKYYNNFYEYTLFLFNKSYIDDLNNKFDIILKDNNLDCINYYDNDNVMKKDKRKYLLDKYLINITDDNIKHLIRDKYQNGPYYFKSFYDLNYTYDFDSDD
ncbi:hypothetical protein QKC54_gp0102 [Megavirus baoshan]|uniref:Uncharacterized protein n=1 Tax=Megavirus baoshan TaxID=2496520 RepID=A0A3S8UYL8_9VIRU|nr:hypothetical protein QKC54_gp0102 [Megavirus baoshan]AZL89809.1 hypothetical protein Mb0970 [Megavirus baoshan]